jgi:hypothetical protein
MANGELPLLDDGTVNPASGYDPQNPDINRDPRYYACILFNGAMWKGRPAEIYRPGGRDSEDGLSGWNASKSGWYIRKFLREGDVVSGAEFSTNPYIIFRLGEFYLNYAECLIALGQEENAKTYINLIRARAGMPNITESGAALIKRYRNERRIELVFESHRWYDILRWKIAGETLNKTSLGVRVTKNSNGTFTYDYTRVVQQRAWNDRQYLLPIPRSEITKSKNVLVQNPSYE